MKKLLLIVGITFGMNTSAAMAQPKHEDMPGHDQMPGGKKMPDGDHGKHNKKKKDGDAEKSQPPKPEDKKLQARSLQRTLNDNRCKCRGEAKWHSSR